LSGVLLAMLLAGCSVAGPPRAEEPVLLISGLVIRNELAYPVTDVMIDVPATGAFAGCGTILRRSSCSNSFPGVDYQRNAVMIRWKEYGEAQSTDPFVIEVPAGLRPGEPADVEVVIFAPGQAGARLVQP
jgi:uncharacterized protein YceK